MSSCSIFLNLTFVRYGRVDGESKTEGYEGQIEVGGFDWNFGRNNSNSDRASHEKAELEFEGKRQRNQDAIDTGIDPDTGEEMKAEDRRKLRIEMLGRRILPSSNQVSLKEFNFTKRFDLSSTVMLSALNSQDEIKEACFTVLRFGQASKDSTVMHTPIYTVKLRRGRVAALTMQVQSEGNSGWALVDTVAFKYRSVDVEYFPVPKVDATPRPVGKTPAKSIGRPAAAPVATSRQAGIPFSYNGP
ncbi:MAG: type VI secretion system tube protein Hcp [Burkholderiaceae bacterium]